MLSPLQTTSTMIDDRTLRAYLRNNAAWNLDESAPGPPIDHLSLSSSGNGDKFLNSSVNFPAEMRSANLNDMVSSIIEENSEYYQNGLLPTFSPYQGAPMMMPSAWSNGGSVDHSMQYMPPMKNLPAARQMKMTSSSLSESGHPRNIPDSCSICHNPPKDIPVLIRKVDHHGINSLITNMSLQQFRQMIGLQSSATNSNDRRISSSQRPSDNRRGYSSLNNPSTCHLQQQPLSSSSSSSSSSIPTSNLRLINGYKSSDNKKWTQETMLHQQQNYSAVSNHDRQHSSMLPVSLHDPVLMNYSATNGTPTMNDTNLISPMATCQDIRRTGVANTLHIAIEKCYEQLNYIRDSYAETESKIGIQMLHKCPSPSSIIDVTNTNMSSLSNNPSRVDRLIAEYHHEYSRMIRLHERVKENLTFQDTEATRQTLNEWLNAINIVQDRRRQEIDNAAEKCRSGEPRLPDEKDVLQLAEALRVLRITTRKIRTVLWYWLYWSTNAASNRVPLIARHQEDQLATDHHPYYSSIIDDTYKQNDGQSFYPSTFHSHEDQSFTLAYPMETTESDDQGTMLLKKKSMLSNENNKENECDE